MFEDLSIKLEKVLKKVIGQGKLTESNISDTLRDIRRVLLDADVNFRVAKNFIEKVSVKALGQEVLASITPGQLITKIIQDELTTLLGSNNSELTVNPTGITVILVVGLQGSGKTTFSAKLAKRLKEQKRKVLLVAADVYRPAAITQLEVLAKQIDVEIFSIEEKNAEKVSKESLKIAKSNNLDTVIIDTAGRLHVDEKMMQEVKNIKSLTKPDEILFVVDSMAGQDSVNSAKSFNEAVDYNGIVLTKLDGDARGGAALSIKSIVGKPIKFISNGEKVDDLEPFYPERLASRILGKGDVVSLVEKAQASFEEVDAQKIKEKLRQNKFDFNDFLKQIIMLKKMGSLSSLIGMIPGMGSKLKNMQIDDNAFIKIEAIINSMTKIERTKPKILNGRRRKRIAIGSGSSIQDVNRLIKRFAEMKKMMSKMNGKGFNKSSFNNLNFN